MAPSASVQGSDILIPDPPVGSTFQVAGTDFIASLAGSEAVVGARATSVVTESPWTGGWIACLTIGCILAAAGLTAIVIGCVARVSQPAATKVCTRFGPFCFRGELTMKC